MIHLLEMRLVMACLIFVTAITPFMGCDSVDEGSHVSAIIGDEGFFYWRQNQLLFRGKCRPALKVNVSNCQTNLEWIGIADILDRLETYVKPQKSLYEAILSRKKSELATDDLPQVIRERFATEAFPKHAPLAVGGFHTCALSKMGDLKCWGYGADGQLGTGKSGFDNIEADATKLGAIPLGESVIQVAGGQYHTCALLRRGGIKCWGHGSSGQLGTGKSGRVFRQVNVLNVPPLLQEEKVVQIAAGDFHTCALFELGHMRCWGHGHYGQLGNGKSGSLSREADVKELVDIPLGERVVKIAAGGFHTCAVLNRGVAKCWGHGAYGQLGTGLDGDDYFEAEVTHLPDIDLGAKVLHVAAGQYHTCALLATGDVKCWGKGYQGQLGTGKSGYGYVERDARSLSTVPLGQKALQVTAGFDHTCALLENGGVKCWGKGFDGQLGTGKSGDGYREADIANLAEIPLAGSVVQIAAGGFHTCAMMASGGIKCWGYGFYGQLGTGKSGEGADEPNVTTLPEILSFTKD